MEKFKECLNDLVNYFVLADPETLTDFQKKNKLPEDLVSEFTTNESGDKAAQEGVIIPLFGIENYPYTIYFNTKNEPTVFDKKNLQIKKTGYLLKIDSGEIYLFTIPYLKNWKEGKQKLLTNGLQPKIKLKKGWYQVEILGGETKQGKYWEPTFEFKIKKTVKKTVFKGNLQDSFLIKSRAY